MVHYWYEWVGWFSKRWVLSGPSPQSLLWRVDKGYQLVQEDKVFNPDAKGQSFSNFLFNFDFLNPVVPFPVQCLVIEF